MAFIKDRIAKACVSYKSIRSLLNKYTLYSNQVERLVREGRQLLLTYRQPGACRLIGWTPLAMPSSELQLKRKEAL